ncbi:MAG: TetR/AcrR family transcriptional regulator [Actinobacteria bacterium]|nr:TetR/AcrR family transcriptional regulator [Actinomycetota bacterium]
MPSKETIDRDPLLARIRAGGADPAANGAGERILEAATQQVEDFGIRRFTIDDVARRVGLSRVTIYRHFPKKDRLVEAVLLRELHRFLRGVDQAVEPYETLEERLVEGFVFGLVYLRRHRLLNRLLRTEPELLLPALTVKGEAVLAAGRKFIAGFARREAGRGGLPLTDKEIDGVSELLARAVLSFVLTPQSVLGLRTQSEIRRFAEHFLAPTLDALTKRPRPSRR